MAHRWPLDGSRPIHKLAPSGRLCQERILEWEQTVIEFWVHGVFDAMSDNEQRHGMALRADLLAFQILYGVNCTQPSTAYDEEHSRAIVNLAIHALSPFLNEHSLPSVIDSAFLFTEPLRLVLHRCQCPALTEMALLLLKEHATSHTLHYTACCVRQTSGALGLRSVTVKRQTDINAVQMET